MLLASPLLHAADPGSDPRQSLPPRTEWHATASSKQVAALAPAHAIDGDLKTRWGGAFSADHWLQVDLGRAAEVGGVAIHWDSGFAASWTIQTSLDGQRWDVAYTRVDSRGDTDYVVSPARTVRYVRLASMRKTADWGVPIFEFEPIAAQDAARITGFADGVDGATLFAPHAPVPGTLQQRGAKLGTRRIEIALPRADQVAGLEVWWGGSRDGATLEMRGADGGWTTLAEDPGALGEWSYLAAREVQTPRALRLTVGEHGAAPVIRRLRLLGPKQVLTRTKRYEIVASRAHRELFPSSLHQQQVYWTAVGIPAGRQKSIFEAMQFMQELRERTMVPGYMGDQEAAQRFHGIIAPSISHEGYSSPTHSYWDDYFAIKGWRDGAWLAEALGDAETARWAREQGDALRESVAASIRATMTWKDSDVVPASADIGDSDPTSVSIALDPTGAQDVLPPAALRTTFDRYLNEQVRPRFRPDALYAYTPYELRNVLTFVHLDRPADANELLRGFVAHQRPRAWLMWPEVVHSRERHPGYIGDMPHTWIGAEYARALFGMLMHEGDDTLSLLPGVPPAWLAGEGHRHRCAADRVRHAGDDRAPAGRHAADHPRRRPARRREAARGMAVAHAPAGGHRRRPAGGRIRRRRHRARGAVPHPGSALVSAAVACARIADPLVARCDARAPAYRRRLGSHRIAGSTTGGGSGYVRRPAIRMSRLPADFTAVFFSIRSRLPRSASTALGGEMP